MHSLDVLVAAFVCCVECAQSCAVHWNCYWGVVANLPTLTLDNFEYMTAERHLSCDVPSSPPACEHFTIVKHNYHS